MSRKNQEAAGRRFRFRDYEADFGVRELRKCGTRIGLQHKPFHVLELLLLHPGQLVTREDLVAHLWPDSFVNFERGLNSAVNSLRQVLGESSRECRFIETRPGIGYRFIAPVEEITEVRVKHSAPRNTEAYQDCLKGRYLLDRMSEEDIQRALCYFHSAAADDSCCSPACAGIADAYCEMALIGSVHSSTISSPARSSAELALSSDADLPHAHVASGRVKLVFDWDWRGAREAASRALELDDTLVSAHTLHASLLCALGDQEAALQICRHSLLLEPLSLPANLQLATCLNAVRDFEGAAKQCWQMLSLWPNFAPCQLLLAVAYEELEMYEEAVVEFQNARLCSACQVAATSGLSHVFAATGSQDEADQALNELQAHTRSRHVSTYWQAVAYAGQKRSDEAITFLEESLESRDPALLSLPADPRFHSMKELPRFQTLLTRLSS